MFLQSDIPVSQRLPVYPFRQLHVNVLMPSTQEPPFWQVWLTHSLMSVKLSRLNLFSEKTGHRVRVIHTAVRSSLICYNKKQWYNVEKKTGYKEHSVVFNSLFKNSLYWTRTQQLLCTNYFNIIKTQCLMVNTQVKQIIVGKTNHFQGKSFSYLSSSLNLIF